MKSYGFLFWAYNVIWAGLAVFVALLIYRIHRTGRRVERIEQELRDKG